MVAGGTLCGIMRIIGILNFFNAMMTGILARKRELAIIQAVGMTNQQVRQLLIYEGLLYSLGTTGISTGNSYAADFCLYWISDSRNADQTACKTKCCRKNSNRISAS